MFGLEGQGMQRWLNACVERSRAGGWPDLGEPFDGVIDGFSTLLRPVHESWHDALFGSAWRFYQGTRVPFVQLVWPDHAGLWPWHEEATRSSRTRQAFAWLPVDEHPLGGWRLVGELGPSFPFPGGPDQYALTSRALLELDNHRVVRLVNHDGGLDVLDARGYQAEDVCLAFLGDIVRRYREIGSLADLPDDSAATIGADGTWTIAKLTRADRDASDQARDRARESGSS
jgi:hypothetical protein